MQSDRSAPASDNLVPARGEYQPPAVLGVTAIADPLIGVSSLQG